jgi:hypothetical protein
MDIMLGEVLGPLEFIDEFRDKEKRVFVLHSMLGNLALVRANHLSF